MPLDLNIPKGITAVVGGGGKTTLIWRLGAELAQTAKVIVTTSTHMWPPDCTLLLEPTMREVEEALRRGNLVAVGKLDGQNKLVGIGQWEELRALSDHVLVEADGSKRLPLKAPAEHEPAMPPGTSLVIAVAGMDGVGRPIVEVAHRPLLYAALLGKRAEDIVTASDVARVLIHPEGQRKGVDCRFAVVLNKADSPERLMAAREAAEGIPYETIIASLQSDEPVIEHRRAGI